MPAVTASAPGKIILLGEHAVVYGRPAIAAPVTQVRARVYITPDPRLPAGDVFLDAPATGVRASYRDLPINHPLRLLVETILEHLGGVRLPAAQMRITSTIPIAAGLGSGSAVSVAAARALSAFAGCHLTTEEVSQIAYIVEKAHHGTPSGVDNTVIAYAQPVFFQRDHPIEQMHPAYPFTLIIGDTGLQSSTAAVVGEVRLGWQADPPHYEALFDSIAAIVVRARQAIEDGAIAPLGGLMTENHHLLQTMGVSCPELDRLVDAALHAGALGAKLSGGGRGGNMIALVTPDTAGLIATALQAAGAVHTITTTVQPTPTMEDQSC